MTKSQFVTFYSYKGGVGRTLTLGNVAWAAALDGKKVVIVDFDLEAPGIPSLIPFQNSINKFRKDCEKSKKKGGLFELILYYQKHQIVPAIPKFFSCDPIKDLNFKDKGSIVIIPAGKEDRKYRDKLQSFNWDDFYAQKDKDGQDGLGREFFLRFRDTILSQFEQPDLILIDSRTGLTDIGGICTILLPDTVVVLTGMNHQNLRGSKIIVDSIIKNSEYRKKENYLKPIKVITVASHIPYDQERDKTIERLKEGKKIFEKDFDIILHYVPILSLEERLLIEDQEKDIQDAGILVKSYWNLYNKLIPTSYFNINIWKEKIETRFNQFNEEIKYSDKPMYATIAGMTLAPLVKAAISGKFFPALNALLYILSNIGTNLLASELEKMKDNKNEIDEAYIIQWIKEKVSHQAELRNEIDQILLEMNIIPLAQNNLNSDDKKLFSQELEKQLKELGNFHKFEQIIVQGNLYEHISINLSEKTALKISNYYQSTEKIQTNSTKAVEKYLSLIRDEYSFLSFKGMGVSDRIPLRLPLVEMYVPLKVRIELPEGETWRKDLKLEGREMTSEDAENIGQRDAKPVLKLLKNHDFLIILGNPGAGKTTFLKYICLKLAMGHGEEMEIGNRLPVLVPLSAYANAIAENKSISLNQFIVNYFSEREVDLPMAEMLKKAMEKGSVFYLLDGLDEVQSIGDRRKVVDRMLAFFRFHQDKKNKIIMTSRIVGYRDVRPVSQNVSECTLVDFETEDIEKFVKKWTKAVEKSASLNENMTEQQAIKEEKRLLYSVYHNKGVRQLASNPLLLTILALMKRQGVSIPERRVELYQNYIYTLLKNWNHVRNLDGSIEIGLDVIDTIRVLAPLALWIHETSSEFGLIKQEGLRLKLEEICAKRGIKEPEQAAQNILFDVHKHTALLLEREPGMYGFIHHTFQVYLAAIAVAHSGRKYIPKVVYTLLNHINDNTWTELTRLCIAYIGIIEGREEAASEILLDLINKSKNKAINLAAKVVKDAYPGGLTIKCKEKVSEILIRSMSGEFKSSPIFRVESGRLLSQIGDSRKEVMTLENMHFCYVPGGHFWMGEDKECYLVKSLKDSFFIGKNPITNAQYNLFVENDGYAKQKYWKEAEKNGNWKKGKYYNRQEPNEYGEIYSNLNHPVVGITWYEAMAFTRWLTEKWLSEEIISKKWSVRLPTETEWEKTARGGTNIPCNPVIIPANNMNDFLGKELKLNDNKILKRVYPWGNEWNVNNLNAEETEIETTNSVGCFSNGKSPYGCEEMSGNIDEWTRSICDQYPYLPEDGRENLDKVTNSISIIIRGGNFRNEQKYQRCSSRKNLKPDEVYSNVGFRVLSSLNP